MAAVPFPAPGGEPHIVLSDSRFLVVSKPSGMHTAPGPGAPFEETLAGWVHARFLDIADVHGRGKGEGGLLHRLDRDTSGLVLFARTEEAYRYLSEAAGAGGVRKEYRLVAAPSPAGLRGSLPRLKAPAGVDEAGWISSLTAVNTSPAPLLREAIARGLEAGRPVFVESRFRPYGPGAARVACAVQGAGHGECPDPAVRRRGFGQSRHGVRGRPAYRTDILSAEEAADACLYIRVALTRGFRHQVRAHLTWIGLPLVGDPLYGSALRGEATLRLYLHAAALEFPHPSGGAAVRVEG
ncbi:MAG TPA: RNA pseudouridine synthase [Magnetospirillaceae bacterium]|nr:RNA pseudouridine synthase [Magnetospirillaceae bacterium]